MRASIRPACLWARQRLKSIAPTSYFMKRITLHTADIGTHGPAVHRLNGESLSLGAKPST